MQLDPHLPSFFVSFGIVCLDDRDSPVSWLSSFYLNVINAISKAKQADEFHQGELITTGGQEKSDAQ